MLFPTKHITFKAALHDAKSSKKSKVRSEALMSLSHLAQQENISEVTEVLEHAFRDDDAEVRACAAFATSNLFLNQTTPPKDSLIDALIQGLSDPASQPRQAAAITLGELKISKAFVPLEQKLRHGSPDIRFQAATALASIDLDKAFVPLMDALNDQDNEVLSAIAIALAETKNKAAIDKLLELMQSKNNQLRFSSAYALAQFGVPQAIDTLALFLHDKKHTWATIEALEISKQQQAIIPLSTCMNRRFFWPLLFRIHAATAIIMIDPQDTMAMTAQTFLCKYLYDSSITIREFAFDSVARIYIAHQSDWAKESLQTFRNTRKGTSFHEEIDAIIG